MSDLRARALDLRAWSVPSWAAPFTVQFVVGVLFIALVMLGKLEFFGAEERVWFLGATVITAVVAATMGVLTGYGAIGFAAATVTILVVSLAAWLSVSYVRFAVYFVPLILVALVAAIILARSSGQLRQAGRGMLVGLLAVPLSPAVMWISVVAMLAR